MHASLTPAWQLVWHCASRAWLRHQVPLLGSIIAGRPEVQEGRMEACIDIDPSTLRLPKNSRTFALKVRGDSMRNAGIFEGAGGNGVRWGANNSSHAARCSRNRDTQQNGFRKS